MKKIILFIAVIFFLNSCKKGVRKTTTIKKINYTLLGKRTAIATKKVLGKNLKRKIVKEGTLAALQFCNIKAGVLTDSMSVVKKTIIRRISDKNRNPKNVANKKELEYIALFKKVVANKKPIKPIVKDNGNKVTFYTPIVTNQLCLQCHGTPNKEITSAVYKEIQKLYPNDKAVGYAVNEVRGLWAITYDK